MFSRFGTRGLWADVRQLLSGGDPFGRNLRDGQEPRPAPTSETHDSDDAHLEKIRKVWQARTKRVLSKEDARQINENLVGFFTTLLRWDAEEREKASRGQVAIEDQEAKIQRED